MRPIFFFFFAIFSTCAFSQDKKSSYYREPFRPQMHFSPAKNWTNDPNGLVYYKGEYHLFYQYNPYGDTWGHMSWGHAVSKDLIQWKHLPVAIPEDSHNMIFSGSCVVDKNNSSGFAEKPGQVPLVAIYTAHIIPDKSNPDDYQQNQHIAYSLDNGRTWQKYAGNPVLDLGKKDFRDPKVFWYAPQQKWVMLTVLPHEHIVQFYGSKNLKQWEHLSDFGPQGDTSAIWECPDLLQVPVAGAGGEKKWVLINSQQTTMQYFVGSFNGQSFMNENPHDLILRPDYGADNYAAITYNNIAENQPPVLVGWANNWQYAPAIPTGPWRGAMTLPRTLSLKKTGDTWILLEQPVDALKNYRSGKTLGWTNLAVNGEHKLPVHTQLAEFDLLFDPSGADSCGIKLAVGNGHYFTIGYKKQFHEIYIDRSQSGNTSFHPAFSAWLRSSVKLQEVQKAVHLHIIFDKSIIEVYVNDGEVVLTEQLFPDQKNDAVVLFSNGGNTIFEQVKIWPLKSAWWPAH
jgi:fructan beta-fructosidase